MTDQASPAGNWALGGIRVLDLTEYVAGPFAGQMLADMGADVIKLEPPQGDQWRLSNMVAADESRGFLSVNRGKRSIVVDLKAEEGREIARKLALQADVLLSSYRPGVAERLGMDYATLSALNPGLIYCHNTAFGSVGPYAGKAGFDLVAQAMTGIISFESFGKAGKPQGITAAAITDFCSGVFMAYAAACALVQRNVTGVGQEVETSLFASGIALQYRPLLSIDMFDKPPRDELLERLRAASAEGRTREEAMAEGYARNGAPAIATNPYYNIYRTKDSHMVIACLNNRLRRASARLLGVDDARVEVDEWDSTMLGTRGRGEAQCPDRGRVHDQDDGRVVRAVRREGHPLRAGAHRRRAVRRPARAGAEPDPGARAPDAGNGSHGRLTDQDERRRDRREGAVADAGTAHA